MPLGTNPITVTAIRLAQQRLRLLDRETSRIYVTELPDPSRYVSAGEVVLSGLLWGRADGDAEPFVAALDRAGVAALAASGGIPGDVVDACARHRIRCWKCPPTSRSRSSPEASCCRSAGCRGGRKRLQSAADAPLPVLLRQGEQEPGAPCWVLSATGRVVGGTGETTPPAEWFVPGRERTVRDGHTLVPVGGRFAVPWILAVKTTGMDDVTDELAGLVSLARARADQVRRTADGAAEALFRALTAGDVAATFPATGLREPVRVILARIPHDGPGLAGELLAGAPSSLLGFFGDYACAIVQADHHRPADWVPAARRALSAVDSLVGLPTVFAGIGGPATAAGLRDAGGPARGRDTEPPSGRPLRTTGRRRRPRR